MANLIDYMTGTKDVVKFTKKLFLGGDTVFTIKFSFKSEFDNFASFLLSDTEVDGIVTRNTPYIFKVDSHNDTVEWQTYKIIYYPGTGIIYYYNDTLLKTEELYHLDYASYFINIFLPENTIIRNLEVTLSDLYLNALLHFENDPTEDIMKGTWVTTGNPQIENNRYSRFGKALNLQFFQNIKSRTMYTLGETDFTLDTWFYHTTGKNASIRLIREDEKETIGIEINSGHITAVKFMQTTLELQNSIHISDVTHGSIVYCLKEKTLYYSINKEIIYKIKYNLEPSEWRVQITGPCLIDELRLCSLALLGLVPKSQYKLVDSIGDITVPDNIMEKYTAYTNIEYNIYVDFVKLMSTKRMSLIKVYTSYSIIGKDEQVPYQEQLFEVNLTNCFNFIDELTDPVYTGTRALKAYLDLLVGDITIPENCLKTLTKINENNYIYTYVTKQDITVPVLIKFTKERITANTKSMKYNISFKETPNGDNTVFAEKEFLITAENYLTYQQEIENQFQLDLSKSFIELDSLNDEVLHIGTKELKTLQSSDSGYNLRLFDGIVTLARKDFSMPFEGIRLNIKNKNSVAYTNI